MRKYVVYIHGRGVWIYSPVEGTLHTFGHCGGSVLPAVSNSTVFRLWWKTLENRAFVRTTQNKLKTFLPSIITGLTCMPVCLFYVHFSWHCPFGGDTLLLKQNESSSEETSNNNIRRSKKNLQKSRTQWYYLLHPHLGKIFCNAKLNFQQEV